MPYREIIAVCSQIDTRHTGMLCGLNFFFLILTPLVHTVTTVLQLVNAYHSRGSDIVQWIHIMYIVQRNFGQNVQK